MRLFVLALALLCGLAAGPAPAAERGQWRVQSAQASGEVQPLKQILGALRGSFPGEVLDASLFENNGAWFYQIKILGPDSRVVEIIVDAQSAQVVSQR
jgi:uncharacterized membrane protein YkoI